MLFALSCPDKPGALETRLAAGAPYGWAGVFEDCGFRHYRLAFRDDGRV